MVHLLRCPPPRRKGTAGPVGFSPSSLAASGQCASNPSIHTRHGTTAPAKQKRSECTATNIQTDTPGEAIGPVPAPHRTRRSGRRGAQRGRAGRRRPVNNTSVRAPPARVAFHWATVSVGLQAARVLLSAPGTNGFRRLVGYSTGTCAAASASP